MAAVSPAGPDPTMMTSRVSMVPRLRPGSHLPARGFTLRSGFARSRTTSDPAEPPDDQEDSAEDRPGDPHVALRGDRDDAKDRDGEHGDRRHEHEYREQAEDDDAGNGVYRLHGALAHEADRVVDRVGGVGGPVAHVIVPGQ